jgi:predicted enzyme related to lactoylglutathione lyase
MGIKLTRPALDAGIVTNDGDAALRFYRDLLGLPELGEISFPGLGVIRRLQVGESILRIVVLDRPASRLASTDGFASQTGLRYLTLSIANLHEVVAAAQEAGYPVPTPPRELRPGTWVAQIEDGLGTTIELMQVQA